MLKPQHRDKLFFNEAMWFGISLRKCHNGNPNPYLYAKEQSSKLSRLSYLGADWVQIGWKLWTY